MVKLIRFSAKNCIWGVGVAALMLAGSKSNAGSYHPIYFFRGAPTDGRYPSGGLVADTEGRLYGTTSRGGSVDGGTVFRLTPPASGAGQWTEEILRDCANGGGGNPYGPVTLGADGSVYGTFSSGGVYNRGTVFKLANQPGWPLTTLHNFGTHETGFPHAGVVFGSDGLLYGTTTAPNMFYAGALFSVSPLGDTVEYAVEHSFNMGMPVGLSNVPAAYNDLVGANGYNYSAFGPLGQVYVYSTTSLVPHFPRLLYDFKPAPDVNSLGSPPILATVSGEAAFYGIAGAGGTHMIGGIYRIAPDGSGGTNEAVLYNFGDKPGDPSLFQQGPYAGAFTGTLVQASRAGLLVGTTEFGGEYGNGAFFELYPPTQPGGAWTENTDVSFNGALKGGGGDPQGTPLLLGMHFYGELGTAATSSTNGAVYELTP